MITELFLFPLTSTKQLLIISKPKYLKNGDTSIYMHIIVKSK